MDPSCRHPWPPWTGACAPSRECARRGCGASPHTAGSGLCSHAGLDRTCFARASAQSGQAAGRHPRDCFRSPKSADRASALATLRSSAPAPTGARRAFPSAQQHSSRAPRPHERFQGKGSSGRACAGDRKGDRAQFRVRRLLATREQAPACSASCVRSPLRSSGFKLSICESARPAACALSARCRADFDAT